MSSPTPDIPSDTLDEASFAEIQYQGAPVSVLERYCLDLKNEREKVYFNPLHPGWSFAGYIPTYHPHSNEPQSGRRAPLACFHEDGQYRFVLKEAIQPFVPPEDHIEWNVHPSQIWVATVQSIDGQDLGSVALKIIQPSLLPIPDSDEDSFQSHIFSRKLALVECFAYKELRSLQGTIIPFMYGYFKASVPSGEIARILVLEHLPSHVPLSRWLQAVGDLSVLDQKQTAGTVIKDMFHTVFETVHRLMDCGVTHRAIDSDLKHILVLPDDSIIIVDFSSSFAGLDFPTVSSHREPRQVVNFLRWKCRDVLLADTMSIINGPDYLPPKLEWEKELDRQDEEEQKEWDRLRKAEESEGDYEASDE